MVKWHWHKRKLYIMFGVTFHFKTLGYYRMKRKLKRLSREGTTATEKDNG